MASRPSENINITISQRAIRLQDRGVVIGVLRDIIEPDGESFVLACIEDLWVEVPRDLELWPLIGQRIVLTHLDGHYKAGRCSI